MTVTRRCSRTGCGERALATLTYVYAEQTAVLGPLATYAEPHSYDLCSRHAERLTAPRGWDVVRLAVDEEEAPDDLVALAEAVREHKAERAAGTRPVPAAAGEVSAGVTEVARRGHLRVLRDR
ncbi:DUF3499 domain-containing protein [Ornithinicoccus halotolerans]|nr:DUF3499 domain-containing protein [Ornithinicoccus halotolerans]